MPTLSHDLRQYLGLLWHWIWLIVLLTVLSTAFGYFLSKRQVPEYRASASLLINESRTVNEYANILASERLAQTYSQLMTQKSVLEGVVERLGLSISAEALRARVSVQVVQNTQLLTVVVEDTDPERAANIANTIGVIFAEGNAILQAERYADSKNSLNLQLEQVDQQIKATNDAITALESQYEIVVDENGETQPIITLEQQGERDRLASNFALYQQIYSSLLQSYESVRLAEIQGSSTVRLVEEATPPSIHHPIRPNVVQDTSLAGLVGLIIGIGLVFVIELLDDTIKGADDVTRHLKLPVLGYIGEFEEEPGAPITAAKPRAPIAEAFRALRTNIQYASVDRGVKTLLITSPSPKDGKSTIAANLSTVIAQSGKRVVLIDSDMRRPSLHTKLQLSNRMGLSELFVQSNDHLGKALLETAVPGLKFIPSGTLPPNPAELVGSEKMVNLLNRMDSFADMVVIDSPPVMAVTDAVVLASRVDGVLLVLRPGVTKLVAAKQTIESLTRGGAKILGAVMNGIGNRGGSYYRYRNYHHYHDYSPDFDRHNRKIREKTPTNIMVDE